MQEGTVYTQADHSEKNHADIQQEPSDQTLFPKGYQEHWIGNSEDSCTHRLKHDGNQDHLLSNGKQLTAAKISKGAEAKSKRI